MTVPDTFKLNKDQTVAVSTTTYWEPDMTLCPRGVTVQLLGAGGVAAYGYYAGDKFWQAQQILYTRDAAEKALDLHYAGL
jgi:hypothetical protein